MKRLEKIRRLSLMMVFLLALAGVGLACGDDDAPGGGNTDAGTDISGDQQVDPHDDVDMSEDPVEDPTLDPVDDSVEDPVEDPIEDPVEDPIEDPVEDVEPEVVEVLCGAQPSLAICDAVTPAPTGDDEIRQYAVDNAIPLRCMEGEEEQWELDVFIEEFEGRAVFMMGETHGSSEIGPASIALFEELYEQGLVDAVALEIGMDTTDAITEYIETGAGPYVSTYGYDTYGEFMFRRLFPDYARERYLEDGTFIPVIGIDTPQRLAWVNEQLEAIAEGIDDETAQGLILDTLPAAKEQTDYGLLGLSTAYVNQCEDYYTHIVDNLETLCPALPDEDACTELQQMAYALWMGAIFNSQDLTMEMLTGDEMSAQLLEWMNQREELIYYNYQRRFVEVENGLYCHMGAAHVAQGGGMEHVGRMLNEDFEPTTGRVYSVAPSYGPGSQVFYGIMAMDAPPEPQIVSDALSDLSIENYFLSTVRPGFDCSESPFPSINGAMGMPDTHYGHWNAFFWYRRLTPDMPDLGWKANLTPNQRWSVENARRTQQLDEAMLRALRP